MASSEGIFEVELDANSTPNEFAMRFLNKLMVGLVDNVAVGDKVFVTVHRACGQCGGQFEVKDNEMVCSFCIEE